MQVLLVDGMRGPSELTDAVRAALVGNGHHVDHFDLVDRGFGSFMSEAERRAYHEPDNLVTEPQRLGAEAVKAADALVIVSALRSGTIDPVVKSFFERVFIPEVSFTFTPSGRITAGLRNLRRVGMVVLAPDDDPRRHGRVSSTRSVIRGVRLNAHRLCKTTYLAVTEDTDAEVAVGSAFRRW